MAATLRSGALGSPAALSVGAYLSCALLTFLVARLAFGPAAGIRNTFTSAHVLAGLALAAGLGAWLGAGRTPGRFWQVVWATFGALVLAAVVAGVPLTRAYGDSEYVLARIGVTVVPKWLAGMALAGWAHATLWEFPPLAAALPDALLTPGGFLGVVGALTMAGASIAVLQRWPDRLAALLPTLTPIWLLLAAGYLEYYPLIAGALLAALAWMFDGRLADRAPRAVGLLVAALPLLYVGFGPLAALLLLTYAAAAPSRAWRALGWALLGFAGLAALLWPPGVADYLRALHREYNLGEAWNYPRYQGQVAGEHTIFFRPAYAFSPARLRELATMYLWGGGIVAPALLAALGVGAARVLWGRRADVLRDARLWLALALLAWQGFYLVFMVPKLGPERDIDLFFAVYITVAFCAGLAADALWPPGHPRRAHTTAALCGAMLGGTAVSALYLMRLGVLGLS